MEKLRGNLGDVVPPAPVGSRISHWVGLEFAFWVVIGLLWLAFEGGVVGLTIVGCIAVFGGFAWRDIRRRREKPLQAQRVND